MPQSAQAGQPEIAVRRTRANLRDQTLSLGSGVRIGGKSRNGPADGIGVPDHIRARAGCQKLIEKTFVVSGTAISIQLGVQVGVRFLGIHARSASEDAAEARGRALDGRLCVGFQLLAPVALEFRRAARRLGVLQQRGVLFASEIGFMRDVVLARIKRQVIQAALQFHLQRGIEAGIDRQELTGFRVRFQTRAAIYRRAVTPAHESKRHVRCEERGIAEARDAEHTGHQTGCALA